jgi:tetratricopeptide (TPR) repeat protein
VNTRIKLTEAGEIRDIFFNFVDREKQNKLVEEKISVIEEHIKNLQIAEAEIELYELAEMPTLKVYESEYLDIKNKLKDAKSILFDIDRNIKFEIEKVNHNISTMEEEKIGYLEKQRNLQKVYKQSIDYLEKIVLYHPYTTFRYDIHKLQGDIYVKMGMINSSKNAYEEADKYINRRKEY